MTWPTGPECVCFDATVLICYQDNGHLDTLRKLFSGRTFTPNVVTGFELVKTERARRLNRPIVEASWLESVPVDEPQDILAVTDLRALWGSRDGRDHGEAEVIVLCERYGWVAVLDDFNGRGAAHDRGAMACVYMCTVIIAAAAVGLCGLTVSDAWTIHRAVERGRKHPRVQDERVFAALVAVFSTAWERAGRPAWPRFLVDPRLDQLVDRADPVRRCRPDR